MTLRKRAIFLVVIPVILSCVCAQKVASAQSGKTKTSAQSSSNKAKPAGKAAAAKADSAASDESGKDKKDEESGESRDPMSSGTFGGLKFPSLGPGVISGRGGSTDAGPRRKTQNVVR